MPESDLLYSTNERPPQQTKSSQDPTGEEVEGIPSYNSPPDHKSPLERTEMELPYRYERTYDKTEAEFVEHRMPIIRIVGEETLPCSDEQILEFIKQQKEMQSWYTVEYWRKKGKPEEQVELRVGEQSITLYNFCKHKPLTDEHITQLERVYGRLAQHFPQALSSIRYFLINDDETPSLLGDPNRYPVNGSAMARWQAFQLFSRGMELTPHRIQAVSNFEGTVAHETTHLIQEELGKPWSDQYHWEQCMNFPDEWELRDSPDGTRKVFFHKESGEMAPMFEFPLEPEECVTDYAKLNMREDICESMVAYLYDPDLLQRVSPGKFEILRSLDQNQEVVAVSAQRIPPEEIVIPQSLPKVIKYYIVEPE